MIYLGSSLLRNIEHCAYLHVGKVALFFEVAVVSVWSVAHWRACVLVQVKVTVT